MIDWFGVNALGWSSLQSSVLTETNIFFFLKKYKIKETRRIFGWDGEGDDDDDE